MQKEDKILKEAINYKFLTNYLKAKIENDEFIDGNEIKRILLALEVEIKTKENN